MNSTDTCCPELSEGNNCDYLDLLYRLKYPIDVKTHQNEQTIPVEVAIHVRLERCTGAFKLGNLVYSTTLLPRETVRLFSINRRSRFHFDSESNITYRHEQSGEEGYYMESFEEFSRGLDTDESGHATVTEDAETSSTGSSRGFLGTIVRGPSVNISGNFNAQSTSEFFRELHMNAGAAHNKSIDMTRGYSSVSIGEVSTRQHVEGESDTQLESASRVFTNNNSCHAVTYLFYQIDKEQTIRFDVKAVKLRVIDPAGDSSVQSRPIARDDKLSVIPTGVLPKSDLFNAKTSSTAEANRIKTMNELPGGSRYARYMVNPNLRPLNASVRNAAISKVQEELAKEGILDKSGDVSKETIGEMFLEFHTTIPTPGVIVKGCLDECNVCESEQQDYIKLDIEHKQLKNELLRKQIDLLENSQEYRCCPTTNTETPEPE